MIYDYKISEQDNRKAIIGTIILHVLLALLLLFYNIITLDPPFPNEEIVMEMDFSGSESAGGAPTQISESTESVANTEDVATQEEESPVTVTKSKTTNTSKTTSTTTTEETKNQDPKYNYGNVFGQGGSGTGEGDKDGDGKNGDGDGLEGPGTTGTTGALSGNRGIVTQPKVDNPIQQEGDVRVQIWIDRTGKVVQVKVLDTNPATTSTSPEHLKAAEQAAWKFKFDPDSNAKEKEYGYITIKFRNQ
ncbi:MAG: energy transducer TonB [Bacteroidia bacterium]